jgi:hypothetical protein
MEIGVAVAFRTTNSIGKKPPFCAAGASADFDAAAVDGTLLPLVLRSCHSAENALPDASIGPAYEAIVVCLLRTIDSGVVGPLPAAFQSMDDPAQNTTVVDTLLTAHVGQKNGSIRTHCDLA